MEFDEDIAALPMGEFEKNGLQVYRNYSKAFTNHREKAFSATIDLKQPDIDRLKEVLSILESEHIKFVPVIACSFADEELKEMYRTNLPEGIPGGKSAMLSGFGPLSSLHTRIQFCFAFDLLSIDLLRALDKLRDQRNKISHRWNVRLFDDFFKDVNLVKLDGLDDALKKIIDPKAPPSEATLRIRTAWLLTRIFYEALWYWKVRTAGLSPYEVLYGRHRPKLLATISRPAVELTRRLAAVP